MSWAAPSERENAPGPENQGAQVTKTDNSKLTESPAVVNHAYLEERGINAQTAEANGVEIDRDPRTERIKERLHFTTIDGNPIAREANAVIWFPCQDALGREQSWIARLLPQIGQAKFLNAKGKRAYPFIPVQTWEARDKPHKPIVITEGPVKALAIIQAGGLPVGLGGVWMATKAKSEEGPIELVSALQGFTWPGRVVYLAFDADYETNPLVRQALWRTVLAFTKLGAVVRAMRWEGAKGIDDYFVTQPDPKAALALLQKQAVSIEAVLRPEDLTVLTAELRRANLSAGQLSQFTRLVAKPLDVRAGALEDDVEPPKKDQEGGEEAPPFLPSEPCLEPVESGAELLEEVLLEQRRIVIMTDSESVATTLFATLTYVTDCVDILPILLITSPEKGCGKTQLLKILGRLVYRKLPCVDVTAAVLFRCIKKWSPTFLIDEADTALKNNPELKSVINSGHTRDDQVPRCQGEEYDIRFYSTFAPKAIAGIGDIAPDSTEDRCIHIRLKRKKKSEEVTKLRDVSPDTYETLRRKLARWALDNGEKIRQARPAIPEWLNDRDGDNWLPLFQIALVAGGGWYEKARHAAKMLSGDDDSSSILLIELRRVFREQEQDLLPKREIPNDLGGFLCTEKILKELNANTEAPWWADKKNGLTAEKLASALRQYGVKSVKPQRDGGRKAGYLYKNLEHVFDRYLPEQKKKNKPQPGQLPADQPPEPNGACPSSKKNPDSVRVENPTRTALSACEREACDEVSELNAEKREKAGEEDISEPEPDPDATDCIAPQPTECVDTSASSDGNESMLNPSTQNSPSSQTHVNTSTLKLTDSEAAVIKRTQRVFDVEVVEVEGPAQPAIS